MPKFQDGTVNQSASPVLSKADTCAETSLSIVPAASGSADRITANPHHRYVMYHDPKPRIVGWTERKVPVHMRDGSGTVRGESPRVAVIPSRGREYEFR